MGDEWGVGMAVFFSAARWYAKTGETFRHGISLREREEHKEEGWLSDGD